MKVLIVFEGSIEVDVDVKSTDDPLTIDEAVADAWQNEDKVPLTSVGENALMGYYDIIED